MLVIGGAIAAVLPYWEGNAYEDFEGPPRDWLDGGLGPRSKEAVGVGAWSLRGSSPFFVVDVARRRSGGWIVVELGDGQVSGLPPHADLAAIFRALIAL